MGWEGHVGQKKEGGGGGFPHYSSRACLAASFEMMLTQCMETGFTFPLQVVMDERHYLTALPAIRLGIVSPASLLTPTPASHVPPHLDPLHTHLGHVAYIDCVAYTGG